MRTANVFYEERAIHVYYTDGMALAYHRDYPTVDHALPSIEAWLLRGVEPNPSEMYTGDMFAGASGM